MYQVDRECVSHLLLHCEVTAGIWRCLSLSGVAWIMPSNVKEAYECWCSWRVEKSHKYIDKRCLFVFFGVSGMKGKDDVLIVSQLLSCPCSQESNKPVYLQTHSLVSSCEHFLNC